MADPSGHLEHNQADPPASPELQQALRQLFRKEGGPSMPQDLRERTRLALDSEWERTRRGTKRPSLYIRAAAAAAALSGIAAVAALMMVVGLPGAGGVRGPIASGKPGPAESTVTPGDIDGSGAVDMVDAFVLARAIAAEEASRDGGAVSALWDVTGDGLLDVADVDAVAMRAVRLDGGVDGDAGGAG